MGEPKPRRLTRRDFWKIVAAGTGLASFWTLMNEAAAAKQAALLVTRLLTPTAPPNPTNIPPTPRIISGNATATPRPVEVDVSSFVLDTDLPQKLGAIGGPELPPTTPVAQDGLELSPIADPAGYAADVYRTNPSEFSLAKLQKDPVALIELYSALVYGSGADGSTVHYSKPFPGLADLSMFRFKPVISTNEQRVGNSLLKRGTFIQVIGRNKDNYFVGFSDETDPTGPRLKFDVWNSEELARLFIGQGKRMVFDQTSGEIRFGGEQENNGGTNQITYKWRVNEVTDPLLPQLVEMVEAQYLPHFETSSLSNEIAAKYIAGGEFLTAEELRQFDGRVFKEPRSGATILLSQEVQKALVDQLKQEGVANPTVDQPAKRLQRSDWAKILENYVKSSSGHVKLNNKNLVVLDKNKQGWIFEEKQDLERGPWIQLSSLTDTGIKSIRKELKISGVSNYKWSDEFGIVGYDDNKSVIRVTYGFDQNRQWQSKLLEYPIEAKPEERAMQIQFEKWANLSISKRGSLLSLWFDKLIERGGLEGFTSADIEMSRKGLNLLTAIRAKHDIPAKFDDGKSIIYPADPNNIPLTLFTYLKKVIKSNDGHFSDPTYPGAKIDLGDVYRSYSRPDIRAVYFWALAAKEAKSNQYSLLRSIMQFIRRWYDYLDRLAALCIELVSIDVLGSGSDNPMKKSAFFQSASQFLP